MPNQLVRHSSFMFISAVASQGLAYLLQVFLARRLGPASYGELGSLLAVQALLSIPLSVLANVIAKFAARYQAQGEKGKIGSLLFASIRKLLVYGVIALSLALILSSFISDFFRFTSSLPFMLIILTTIFWSFLVVGRGILQGTQKFEMLAKNQFWENLFRLVIGVFLVMIGLGVEGAILGYALAFALAFMLVMFPLKVSHTQRDPGISLKEMWKYSGHALVVAFLVIVLIDGPTLLVKRFYSAEFTGYWNASLNLARIIPLFGSAVSGVMFSQVSSSLTGVQQKKIFRESFLYVALFSLVASVIFFFFAEPILVLCFGPAYAPGAVILQWMGLAMSLIGFIHLRLNYRLGVL